MIFEQGTNKVDTEHYIIPFGKYTGLFVSELYSKDPKYFIWLFDKARDELKKSMVYVLKKNGGEINGKKISYRPTHKEYFLKDAESIGEE